MRALGTMWWNELMCAEMLTNAIYIPVCMSHICPYIGADSLDKTNFFFQVAG